MSVAQILSICRERAIQLRVDGEKLTLVGQQERIDESIVSLIRHHKSELIELLTAQNKTEAVLAALWRELLGKERIDSRDHFFELGGHSLVATRLTNRIRAQLCPEIDLAAVFRHPVLADLARHIDMLAAQRRLTPAVSLPPVVRRPENYASLSFAQQQMWVIDRVEQGSTHYNGVAGYRFQGALNREALVDSLRRLVERHCALRTRFVEKDGEVRQIISDDWTLPVPISDWTGLDESLRAQSLAGLIEEECRFRFDLGAGVLVRVCLVLLAAEETVVVLNIHHIACDAWSVALLVQELRVLYEAAVSGTAAVLPELRIRYTDYAQWQRECFQGERLQALLAFWQEAMKGAAPLHEIPLDRPRPTVLQHAGGEVIVELGEDKLRAVQRLAASARTTAFICLESLFALFVARLSGRGDVVVGTPASGRWHADIEPVIGLFANTIPLRHRVEGDPTLRRYLVQSHATVSAALAHQQCPFELLVDHLGVERSLACNPLFQIVFALRDEAGRKIDLPGVMIRPLEGRPLQSKFDLMLSAVDTGQGLRLEWQYAAALFDRQSIELMAAQFVAFLDSALQAPDARVSELSLLSELDRQVLATDAQPQPPIEGDLYSLFLQSAQAHRHAVAVEDGDRRLTYGELAESAGRVAAHLLAAGVVPGDRVGLYLPRSLEFIRCMLGIVQIGATYVPLDPTYPAARLQLIARDAELSAVIATEDALDGLPGLAVRMICVGELDRTVETPVKPGILSARTVAYLMYTSGSSGAPKGVMVMHGGIIRLVVGCSFMPLNERTVMLHLAPVAFDAATLEIWGPLLNGGRMVIYPEAELELDRLSGFLDSRRVNALWLTAALFDQWVAQLDTPLTDLRHVITGGDVVTPTSVRRLYDLLPQIEIINGYGPTENTTFTCCHSIPRDGSVDRPIPIGHPIRGTTIRVLDAQLKDRPLGTIGELYACGAGLAVGYWRNETLTRERFVRDPRNGQMIYRTGDLVRRGRDGVLQFVGRADDQVKIRGYRVEPGEIERCLIGQPGVKEVAVSVLGEDKQLVAYFTRDENVGLAAGALHEALHQYLAGVLPAFMIPTAFVELEALPLGPNGKLDRRALPVPARSDYIRDDYVEPEGALERTLAQIWSRLLGLERVGARDHFFRLGGNSLLATRMASALQDCIGVRLPLREVYQRGTVRELSQYLAERSPPQTDGAVHPISRQGPLPASYAQQRLWFIDRMAGGSPEYNMPALFELRGNLSLDTLQAALDQLVERHEILRTTYAEVHGAAVQIIAPPASQPIRYHDLRDMPLPARYDAAERLFESDAGAAFDLCNGPLFRLTLVQLGADEYRLLFNMHHIASDGWSLGVLTRDLRSLYAAASHGTQASLPALRVQYADYTQWQRDQFSSERRETLLNYWREQLRDLPPLHRLPTDKPRPPRITTRGAELRTFLDQALAGRLLRLANSRGVSLFCLLQAAFSLLLCRVSGERDVVMGTPVAGRERSELEPMVGCFVNTVVLRNRVPECGPFVEFLAQTHVMVLAALEHQALPFDMLVEELNPPRSASHLPLMQLWFVMQNTEAVELALPDVRIRELARSEVAAKFDLMLSATEKQDGRIELHWVCNVALFDERTIQSWAESFAVLVAAIAAQPTADVADLPLLSAGQRAVLDRYAADVSLSMPADTLLSRFRSQALKEPNAIAIHYLGRSLTYAQLASRVERLAGYLIELGVAAEDLVGVCCERSIEQLIAVLGIWQAGAAYVPLDVKAPVARLSFIVRETATKLLLVTRGAADLFDLSQVDLLVLDGAASDEGWLSEYGRAADLSRAKGLAYVLYTSGTTGRPKGVMVSQASLSHLEAGLHHLLITNGCKTPLRWAWNAPLVFDASLQALTQLTRGGMLHLLSEDVRVDPRALLSYLLEHDIDMLDCTPGLLELLLIVADRADCALPHLLVGGEPIHDKQWDDIARRMAKSQRVAINVYGPTETTVDATWAPIRAGTRPNIGRPLPNVEVRVLGANLRELPPGAQGECCIGGPGVGCGYLARPELSAEKFVRIRPGAATFYRSGDLVRWAPGGELIYLGRQDTQVKLRGYRVELAEVEQVILGLPGVAAAAVVVAPGGATLIAYFVPTMPESADDSLVADCRRMLPEYMVPSVFIRVDEIPLTANGKLNVAALPAPPGAEQAQRLRPSSATEKHLHGIWQRLLKTASLGVDSNFFAMGGHSLLAIRVVSAVREEMGVELPLAALFRQPTIVALAKVIDELERKRVFPALAPVARSRPLPLSFSQYRLWLIDRMEGGSPQYNMSAAYRLQGALDVTACRRGVDFLVARHEVLRTSYREIDGQPAQIVQEQVTVPFVVTDLTHLTQVEHEQAVQDAVRSDAAKAFDLTGTVMLRVELLKLARDHHVLLFNMHHIACDGWSVTLLTREFVAAYEAFSANRAPTLQPLSIQYGDFAVWQRVTLTQAAVAGEIAYWQEHLRGLPQLHSLPLDKPRPARQTYNGANITRHLTPATAAGLKRLAAKADVTLFVALQTALAALFARWSNQEDIVIGTPVAGRDEASLEPLIGFFLNTLVIRNDLSGNPSFREMLERARSTVLAAFEHRSAPFEMLVDALKPERSLSHPPLFQIMFVLHNQEAAQLRLPALSMTPVESPLAAAKFDLLLSAQENAAGIGLSWTYSTDLFAAATVERMADGLEQLILDGIRDEQTRLAALNLLPGAQRQQILVDWNDTRQDLPYNRCLHELFIEQVAVAPDRVALVDVEGSLTYAELFQRALCLAEVLGPHLIEPESLVGVLLPKGRGQLVATLAVMMAGGAYLPLDVHWPKARVDQILAHARARAIVSSPAAAAGLQHGAVRIFLDWIRERPMGDVAAACARFKPLQTPGSLAYVIFTSGSTGTPKGVAIEHRSAVNTLLDINRRYGVTGADSVLAVSALSFDLSVYDLFGLLAAGGCVVFPDDRLQKDPAHWAELVERHHISIWDTVPACAELVTAHFEYRQLRCEAGLRVVMMSGDWIPPALPRRIRAVFGDVQVHGLGGATEGSIWSISYPITTDTTGRKSVPYGRPLANQSFHVLSEGLQPCPVGVTGELYIGGAGVAREYYRDPERTAASFIQHPELAARLYRTGDLGRYFPDGNIEFIGRKDQQVKIRGFRIELGEIEAVLGAHAAIEDAVVLALLDPSGVKQLVAYCTLADRATDRSLVTAELRKWLASALPDYMVPAQYVVLDAFPLTANQKIDRARLPEPQWREQERESSSAPPRTETERLLLQIWQEVLGREVPCIDRNFFEVGGTSVHLIQIADRVGKRLQRQIGVVSFFEHPTIESMARFMDEQVFETVPAAGRVKREQGRLAQVRARRK